MLDAEPRSRRLSLQPARGRWSRRARHGRRAAPRRRPGRPLRGRADARPTGDSARRRRRSRSIDRHLLAVRRARARRVAADGDDAARRDRSTRRAPAASWSRVAQLRDARARAAPCSFFAAWYSKFSDRSPCSRAVAIASTTACRFGPSSSASSASSCPRSARVSCFARIGASGRSRRSRRSSPAAAAAERRLLRRAMNREGGELLRDVRRGAVRAGDLLVAADELLEVRLALHADVLVDRHGPQGRLGLPGIHYGAGATK